MARKLLGTLRFVMAYGAGNPRDFFSSRAPSLLKFQSLKLKGIEEKRRGDLAHRMTPDVLLIVNTWVSQLGQPVKCGQQTLKPSH